MGSDSELEKTAQKEREKKKMLALAPIAKPLAGKKLCKRALKLVRRAAEQKCLKRGVKEVVKSIRRGNIGLILRPMPCLIAWEQTIVLFTSFRNTELAPIRLCVIAGNISPIDVITHVPILCEEANIPYVYVPSKEDLANAGATKRPTCCVLVLTKPTKGELGQEEQDKLKGDYDQLTSELSELVNSMF
ncbi:hypothetical protein DH2020_010166 [Rehmannia glutinosa]|uniref:H/ACA ribonucleoprotein complex subunit 2 n=1 Tax=Rehmannia glutinosa TaxID=99300 RepID=A0ABR0X8E3_REHGL